MSAFAAALLVTACGSTPNDDAIGQIGFVEGFLGGVVADEPRAALIGRDVLSAGGTAADAAVAVAFALSVTYPASASLGGGGMCVIHNNKTKKTEALDFLARAPGSISKSATRPSAVPGIPRGMFALHSRYGRLRWTQLIAPAEQLARFGSGVTRAFARELQAVGPALVQDPEARRIFGAPSGGLVGESERLVQVDLAAILSNIRRQGPGEFYTGQLAGVLVTAVNESGGSLSLDDLRSFTPQWRETTDVPFGNHVMHFAPPPAAAGTVEAQIFALLTAGVRYDRAPADVKPHLMVEAFKRAFAERDQWYQASNSAPPPKEHLTASYAERLMSTYDPRTATPAASLGLTGDTMPENPAATSFIVIDREGSAVSCAFTMNNLFGTGRVARGTGIMLAAVPGEYAGGPLSLGPMLVVNHNSNKVYAAAAASGGVTAPTALSQVVLSVLADGQSVEAAILAKRIHHGGRPDLTYFEPGLEEEKARSLTERQHRVAATPLIGRVNMAYCPNGVPTAVELRQDICSMRADPRGYGLAATAD